MPVGRRRTKHLQLPLGVRLLGRSLFWQPTKDGDRVDREQRGLPTSVPLGPAVFAKGQPVLTKSQALKWVELAGMDEDLGGEDTVGYLVKVWKRDAIGIKADGSPRAAETIRSYKYAVPAVLERFGAARYGKTEHDASRGKALGPADIKRFIRACPRKGMANIYLAVLNNSFVHGIGEGFTVYNPCEDVAKNAMKSRRRSPAPWEFECLQTLAKLREQLLLEMVRVCGDRIREMLGILRADGSAEGITIRRKGGKVETWRWSPRLRWIWEEALKLPGATPFAKSPLFPARRGRPLSYSGFNSMWQALKLKTNAALAGGVLDLGDDEIFPKVFPGLVIEDLHFHDWRSKTHDDARDQGRKGHEQIGDTEAVAVRHYARRPTSKAPLE